MHLHSLDPWTHEHVFLGENHLRNARRTWFVVGLTAAMMVVEIAGGMAFRSMALLADGWHMATHAAALGIAGLAYRSAHRHAGNRRFSFGSGKFGDLAGFASAVILAIVAIQIGYESVVRLLHPLPIAYTEAAAIAAIGLSVNLISAWLLWDPRGGHADDHHHDGGHRHQHHGDNNLRAAYLHVLADAVTSLLAIAALLVGLYSGWRWTDAVVGVIGSVVIASWAYGLIRDSGAVLLDVAPDTGVEAAIRERLESGGDRITDLHVWQIGPSHRAAVVSLISDHPLAPAAYKARLADVPHLSHVTVEVEECIHPTRDC
jgi:cation diffusion facilitator family transporter